MSKQWRRRLAVVAVETQYGVAPDPATATILEVVMLDAGNPYAGNTVERERMRYGFGGFEQINTGPNVERQIRVPFSGSGTAGEPPAYSPLLRACGLSETIDNTVDSESVTYEPVSQGMDSVTIWWYEDGQVQEIRGARGTYEIGADAQSLPYWQFNLTGLYSRPENAPSVQGAESTVAGEVPINKQNSTFTLFGYPARLQAFSQNAGNQVEYRNLVGYEGVHITDRRVTGNITIEAPALADFNAFEKVESHQGVTLGAVALTHGTSSGNIITAEGLQAQAANITPSDNQGIMHYGMEIRYLPTGSNDDDVKYVFT
ncbi:phage tail tube protein [Halomonas sp. BMC6]|uniref:phage tail tube protein n=1 Tax=Halomonas sp. BMC6 TaxID=3073244 RepID=UPI0030D08435